MVGRIAPSLGYGQTWLILYQAVSSSTIYKLVASDVTVRLGAMQEALMSALLLF